MSRQLTWVCVFFFLFGHLHAKALSNMLANHASPYLAMHGQDPVQWQEWNASTVNRARKENKLLFVSSGYFSCHWCHVMQRESFQDKNIAALLNQYFIPVKVDRELNAALDNKLIDFVERTQGIAGWPLNVFITPEGYPLVGMVYMPPENFYLVLNKLKDDWRNRHAELNKLAREAVAELEPAQAGGDVNIPAELAAHYEAQLLQQALALADELQGGFGQENKFPSVPQLDALLSIYARSGQERLGNFLKFTLFQMASQGLRDQLGGGFYRYSVDPAWQVPHFEKMLYDNALLASLYLRAAGVLKQEGFKSIAIETLDFMRKQMALPGGALSASFSAIDAHNVEGGYYLWHQDEVQQILNPQEWQAVKLLWHLDEAPELEEGHHLVQAMSIPQLAKTLKRESSGLQADIESARKKLLLARGKRTLPKDNKALAAWNGLALSAFTEAAQQGLGKTYRQQAASIKEFLLKQLWHESRLYRLRDAGGYQLEGDLEDYAYVAQGLLDWAALNQQPQDWAAVETVVQQAWRRFYSDQGWRLQEDSLLRYRESQTLIADGPMPSASAVLISTSLQLATRRGNQKLQQQALRALNVGHDRLSAEAFWHASHLKVLMDHLNAAGAASH